MTVRFPSRRQGFANKSFHWSPSSWIFWIAVAFCMGLAIDHLFWVAVQSSGTVAGREGLMLRQLQSLQRELSIRDTELLNLRAVAEQTAIDFGVANEAPQDLFSSRSRKQPSPPLPPPSPPLPLHSPPLPLHSPPLPPQPPALPRDQQVQRVPNRFPRAEVPSPGPGILKSRYGCEFAGPTAGYLGECTDHDKCTPHTTLISALDLCSEDSQCGGVTRIRGDDVTGTLEHFELRAGTSVQPSPDGSETSFVRHCSTTSMLGNAESTASLVLMHDVDPLPPFYDPKNDGISSPDDVGSFVNGLPTIYLMLASYRDELCHRTIADAFEKATHPDRVFVGIVEQNEYEVPVGHEPDVPCLAFERLHHGAANAGATESIFRTCEEFQAASAEVIAAEGGMPVLCRWGSHLRLYKQRARDATGPTFARHVGDRLYRGEYFFLQTDAHMTFVTGWDEDVTAQFDAAKNDMAVLTTYPTEVEGSLDSQGRSKRRTTPVMCATQFTSDGLLRHGSAIEIYPMFGKSPVLQPFWAAGFSFSRGHFALRVPYDCCTPMLFQGEEIDIAVRAWTSGYDMYTPHNSVAFHPYHRKSKPPMFWENTQRHRGEGAKSASRVRALIQIGGNEEIGRGQMSGGVHDGKYETTDAGKYGLGKARRAEDFYRLFGIDRRAKDITKDLCEWSTTGRMHRQLSSFMRPDKKGIDYDSALASLGM